jgi:phosphoribosylcarboxyaminoimidazole (NCAIR) mutase
MDIISTRTSSWMTSAASAAARPEMKVASTGVPVAGQTCDRVLKHVTSLYVVQSPHSSPQDNSPRFT